MLEIETGVAIVAASYWGARKAQEKLKIQWLRDEDAPLSSADISELYHQKAQENNDSSKRSDGDVDAAFDSAHKILEFEFEAPFLAHATMEPMNCTAHVQDGKADIWTGTQAPDIAQVAAAKVCDVSLSDVTIHNQFIGGGFGRRLTQDFVAEAAAISEISQQPIKLIWSREEDTQRDWYRPSSYHKLSASIDKAGNISGWNHQMAGSGVFDYFVADAAPAQYPFMPKFMYGLLESAGKMGEGIIAPADGSIYEGAEAIPYDFANINVDYKKCPAAKGWLVKISD